MVLPCDTVFLCMRYLCPSVWHILLQYVSFIPQRFESGLWPVRRVSDHHFLAAKAMEGFQNPGFWCIQYEASVEIL